VRQVSAGLRGRDRCVATRPGTTRLAHAGWRDNEHVGSLDGRLDNLALLAAEVSLAKGCRSRGGGQRTSFSDGSASGGSLFCRMLLKPRRTRPLDQLSLARWQG